MRAIAASGGELGEAGEESSGGRDFRILLNSAVFQAAAGLSFRLPFSGFPGNTGVVVEKAENRDRMNIHLSRELAWGRRTNGELVPALFKHFFGGYGGA